MKKAGIKIIKAIPSDFPEILECIKELALFEKAPEKVTNNVAQMHAEKDYFQCYIARDQQGNLLGFALYFFAYYTWVGKSLYLDDIYVKEPFRKFGIGKALLRKIFETAKTEKCSRVRFQVLEWNSSAIEFYRKTGVTFDHEWINCDYDREFIMNN